MYRNLKKTQQRPISKSSPTASAVSVGEIPSKSSIIIRKRKLENADEKIDLGRSKESTKAVNNLEKSPIGESNDHTTNTGVTQKGIRQGVTNEIETTTNKSNTLLGLEGYSSSDEE